jgi:hypothetical protein
MTVQNQEQLTTLIFFLKGAKDEHLYFNGWSSMQAWEAAAQITCNVSGDVLEDLLNKEIQKEKDTE